MDDYRPPPAYGPPPSGHGLPQYPAYAPPNGQGDETGSAAPHPSTYDIPGLQFATSDRQPNSFAPFAQLWQQLQSSNLLSFASNSFIASTAQSPSAIFDPSSFGPSTAPVRLAANNEHEVEEDEDDLELDENDDERGELVEAEDDEDDMARSGEEEVSDGEILSDTVGAINGRGAVDRASSRTSGLGKHSNVLETLSEGVSSEQAHSSQLWYSRSKVASMENGHGCKNPLIPGLGAAPTMSSESDANNNEMMKDVLRDLSAHGDTYGQLHNDDRWTTAERRHFWALWNECGLPLNPGEHEFYTLLFEHDDKTVEEWSGSAFLAALRLATSTPAATLQNQTQTATDSAKPINMTSGQTAHSVTPAQSLIASTTVAPIGSSVASGSTNWATALLPPAPSRAASATQQSVAAKGPSPASSGRDAYLARLQALKNKKNVSEQVAAATASSTTSVPSISGPGLQTHVPGTAPKIPNQSKDAILKQKLEALRKSASRNKESTTHVEIQPRGAASLPHASTAVSDLKSENLIRPQPSPKPQTYSAVSLPHHSSPPLRQSSLSSGSPDTPTTPIPGLFIGGAHPAEAGRSLSPPQPLQVTNGGLTGYTTSAQPLSTASKTAMTATEDPVDPRRGGNLRSSSLTLQSALPTSIDSDQQLYLSEQKQITNDDEQSAGEESEATDVGHHAASQSRRHPITEPVADDQSKSTQVTIRATSATDPVDANAATSELEGLNIPQQPASNKEQIERRLAELRAKMKADRAQKLQAAQKLPPADVLAASAPVNGSQPNTSSTTLVSHASDIIGPVSGTASPDTTFGSATASSQSKKRPSEEPQASPEWRKRRRAEIQANLQNSEQDLGSTAAKIAEMQRQLALLQEEQMRKQQARELLAKQLEEFGVDTEGMSHEEMQATKDDIEAAQQASEDVQKRTSSTDEAGLQPNGGAMATDASNAPPATFELTSVQALRQTVNQVPSQAPASMATPAPVQPQHSHPRRAAVTDPTLHSERVNGATQAVGQVSFLDDQRAIQASNAATALPTITAGGSTMVATHPTADLNETQADNVTGAFDTPSFEANQIYTPNAAQSPENEMSSEGAAMSMDTTDEEGEAEEEANDVVQPATLNHDLNDPPSEPIDRRPWESYVSDGDAADIYDPEHSGDGTADEGEIDEAGVDVGLQAEVTAQQPPTSKPKDDDVEMIQGPLTTGSLQQAGKSAPTVGLVQDMGDSNSNVPLESSKPDGEDDDLYEPESSLPPSPRELERENSFPVQSPPSAAHVAPELDPSNRPLESETSRPQPKAFVPYESPLSMFRAYRYHPEYSQKVPSFRSLTYSNAINPMVEFCPTELERGLCQDRDCPYQHFLHHFDKEGVQLSGDKVLIDLGLDNPGRTEEERLHWNMGLKELIKDLRASGIGDSETVAKNIAAYRRHFLEELGLGYSVLKLEGLQ